MHHAIAAEDRTPRPTGQHRPALALRTALAQVLPLTLLTAALAVTLVVTTLTGTSPDRTAAGQQPVPLHATPVAVRVSTNTTATRAYEARILTLVNAQRARHGLRPLVLSSCADRFATRWSTHLASVGALSHQSLWTILRSCPARAAGENVGWTTSSADAMVRMWMNSPGHRANILSAKYHRLGLGVARTSTGRWYATQDFLS
ncbi:MAG TPA: CAP domain-containing protein [Motilibacteraceae bacterium]|nr:CAP domain-containing protein [Motilibacteraceae bacterium]